MSNTKKIEVPIPKEHIGIVEKQAKTYLLSPENYILFLIGQDIQNFKDKGVK